MSKNFNGIIVNAGVIFCAKGCGSDKPKRVIRVAGELVDNLSATSGQSILTAYVEKLSYDAENDWWKLETKESEYIVKEDLVYNQFDILLSGSYTGEQLYNILTTLDY